MDVVILAGVAFVEVVGAGTGADPVYVVRTISPCYVIYLTQKAVALVLAAGALLEGLAAVQWKRVGKSKRGFRGRVRLLLLLSSSSANSTSSSASSSSSPTRQRQVIQQRF